MISPNNVLAVILGGGVGKRLYPLTVIAYPDGKRPGNVLLVTWAALERPDNYYHLNSLVVSGRA